MKVYSKLEEKFEYDKEQATELAEAMTELVEVQRRAKYLTEVVNRHNKLKKFLWGSEDGRVTAIHDLETSHLRNILLYLPKKDREASPQLKAEARSRNIDVEGSNGLAPLRAITASSAYLTEDELDFED